MTSQYQIEQTAGIKNDKLAKYISDEKSDAAKNALNLLGLCVSRYEPYAFGLLCEAVKDCKKELAEICKN